MKSTMQKMLLGSVAVILAACGGSGGGSGGAALGTLPNKASVSATDKALLVSKNSASSMGMSKSSVTAQSSLTDDLVKMDINGDLTEVSFVSVTEGPNGPIETPVTVAVLSVIQLTDRWVVLMLDWAGQQLLMDKDTGNLYDVTYLDKESIQVYNGFLYGISNFSFYRLDTGAIDPYVLLRINLASQELEKVKLHESSDVTSNGLVYTQFRAAYGYNLLSNILSVGTVNNSMPKLSLIIGSNFIFAKAEGYGPASPTTRTYAGRSILVRDGQQAVDCGGMIEFSSAGGGFGGGIIRSPNGGLYAIQVVNSLAAANVGETLARVNVESDMATHGCYNFSNPANEVVRLFVAGAPNSSHFPVAYQDMIAPANTNYTIDSYERYYLSPTGFLRTMDDGSGGLTMTWTNLNLSVLPRYGNGAEASNKVLIEGDKVYYRIGRNISVQTLQSGSTASLFHTAAEDIQTFAVVDGEVLFSTASGTYKVSGIGQAAELVSTGVLESAAKF